MKKRKLFQQIVGHLDKKEHTIIVGPRQAGKTTLLKQIEDYLKLSNNVVYFFNLEDATILQNLNQHPENIFHYFNSDAKSRIILLIDEVQYLKNPSNFLKLLYDKHAEKIKIIATGSSAFYIDLKFNDSLAGRKRLFNLYTLDFDEFLMFKSDRVDYQSELQEIRKNSNYLSLHRKQIESLFYEYLSFGGYPAVVVAPNPDEKKLILKELLFSYMKRDIYESRIQDEEKFNKMLQILASQIGGLINKNELSNTLQLSTTSVDRYITILRKTFHIHLVLPFYQNLRKELTKMPKVFFNDLGLRNALLNQFMPLDLRIDKGSLLENYVFVRLREIYGTDIIKYWRTANGNEVDFIIQEQWEKGFAIEVKHNYNQFKLSKYKIFTNTYSSYPLQCRAFISPTNKENVLGL